MTPSEFIERVYAVADEGSVSDEAVSNLSVEVEMDVLSEDVFTEFFEGWNAYPSYFSGFQLVADNQRLIELSGRKLRANNDGLSAIAERELEPSVNVRHHQDGFDRYYPDEISETAHVIYQFAAELDDAGITTVLRFGLRKEQIALNLLAEGTLSQVDLDLKPMLWWTPTELFQWIGTKGPDEVALELFEYDAVPVFLFFQGAPKMVSPLPMWPAKDGDALPREDLEGVVDKYRELMASSRKYTHWRRSLSPIHPYLIEGLWEQCAEEEVDKLYTYSLLGVLSVAVEKDSSNIQFNFSNEPEFTPEVNLEEQCRAWGEDGISAIQRFHQSLQGEENKDAFRDLWQLAITEQCRGTERGIDKLPEVIEEVKSSYQDLQVSAVEENFEALSDVLEDTQTLMAGLTDRLSSAASATSQDIQRLTFTLLGAIVANIFLVLRWSDRSLVPTFSLFVIIVIVGFYLPLIQGRIEDLENTIKEVKNDYEFYEKHIRRFNKELFQFGNLEDRKSAYVKLANKQRKRAQTQLRRVFYALMVVWCGLAIWSGIIYPFGQSQSVALAISGLLLGILSFGPKEGAFGHSGYDYFDRKATFATIVIIFASFFSPLISPVL